MTWDGDGRGQGSINVRDDTYPLHSTKLPLSTWLKALWLILQSDKGLSSVRLVEVLGVSQPTAWRMGHAPRLLLVQETPLGGTIEIDEFFLGGRQKKPLDAQPSGRGRKGQKQTTKKPVLAMVQRPRGCEPATYGFDKETLIRLILSQAEAIERLTKEVEALRSENVALRAKLDLPPKTPDNSSTPPSQGHKVSGEDGKA